MQESLFERFRPFKPYDLVLVVALSLLIVPGSRLAPVPQAITVAGSLLVFWLLDSVQRLVRVPTPLWQAMAIVCTYTVVIGLLIHLHSAHAFSLSFAMVNVAFATVAFGQHAGIAASVLSVAVLANLDSLFGTERPMFEWMLFLAVLLAVVAILVRINRLQQDALFDVVTNLRNHRYFQVRLREELQRSDRYGRPTALLLLDLDNFKRINDQFGHAAGDQVLRQVSRVLSRNVRASDVVCRYGGDELAVILPETPLDEASQVAERFRQAVAQRPEEDGAPPVAVSVGVAVYPEHALQADQLAAAADRAMYRAKHAGRNQVAVAERWRNETYAEQD